MLAYVHVDVLYHGAAEMHAEALANLVELFGELHKPDHAARCLQKLKQALSEQPVVQGEVMRGRR